LDDSREIVQAFSIRCALQYFLACAKELNANGLEVAIMRDTLPSEPDSRQNLQPDSPRKPVLSADFVPEPLLDTEQAAAIMKVHPKTLQKFARRGLVRGVHVGKLWRFRGSEIDAWIERQMAN
jgi:excisionase family DNA binding protein